MTAQPLPPHWEFPKHCTQPSLQSTANRASVHKRELITIGARLMLDAGAQWAPLQLKFGSYSQKAHAAVWCNS